MKRVIIISLVILITGCIQKKPQSDYQYNNKQDNNLSTDSSKIMIEEEKNVLTNENYQQYTGEEKLQYFGMVYNSFINDDNVNVRAFPSIKAEVLTKLNKNSKVVITGTSKEIDEIDNFIGNWLNIRIGDHWESGGWVFSKYVENGQILTSEITIHGLLPKVENRAQGLMGSQKINGVEREITLYPHKLDNQDFYTFAYDYTMDFFHYSNIPGSYAWYPKTNELKHITYMGTDLESGWVVFTDDFKYLIEDFGTGPGPRELGVWRIEDTKRIFSGTYYRNINLHGNKINVVYVYDNWNISNNRLDNEIIDYANIFKENNNIPEDMIEYSKETGLGVDLIITCELDLDTNNRKIIRGEYIYTQ